MEELMELEVRGTGHVSRVIMLNRQREFLEELIEEGPPDCTYAQAVSQAIELARLAWEAEGQQDGPGS